MGNFKLFNMKLGGKVNELMNTEQGRFLYFILTS